MVRRPCPLGPCLVLAIVGVVRALGPLPKPPSLALARGLATVSTAGEPAIAARMPGRRQHIADAPSTNLRAENLRGPPLAAAGYYNFRATARTIRSCPLSGLLHNPDRPPGSRPTSSWQVGPFR